MNTIHLTTSSKFIQEQNVPYSQTIIAKFVECCLKLDASIFEPYMHEDDVFEDKEKYTFLAQLHGMFDEFARDTLDDFSVALKDTFCKGCLQGQPVKHFKVTNNLTKIPLDEFAFMIEVQDGVLKDIYRCYDFKGCRTITIGGGNSGFPAITLSYDLFIKDRKRYLASKASK